MIKGLIFHIISLSLAETWVNDDALADFFSSCTGLKRLDLRATQIGDQTVLQLKSLRLLRHLQLEETKLTDRGLAALKGLMQLHSVGIAKTRVTDDGIRKLQAALPKCRIVTKAVY